LYEKKILTSYLKLDVDLKIDGTRTLFEFTNQILRLFGTGRLGWMGRWTAGCLEWRTEFTGLDGVGGGDFRTSTWFLGLFGMRLGSISCYYDILL
jgi:hypothetical protein